MLNNPDEVTAVRNYLQQNPQAGAVLEAFERLISTSVEAIQRARVSIDSALSDIGTAIEHVEPYVDVNDGADGPRPNDAMKAQDSLDSARDSLAQARNRLA